jgi:hypothetical protein
MNEQTPLLFLFYPHYYFKKRMASTSDSKSINLTSIQRPYKDCSTLPSASANKIASRRGSLTNTLLTKTNSQVLSESLELMEFSYQNINNNNNKEKI